MRNYSEGAKNLSEEKVNLRFITLSVIIIVVLLTVIYSFQQYINTKKTIVSNITGEAQRLERILLEELDEVTYLLSVMVRQLSNVHTQDEVINLFQMYVQDKSLKEIFSVGNIVWVNKNQRAIIDAKNGVERRNRDAKNDFNIQRSRQFPGRIIWGTSKNHKSEKTLVGTISMVDPITNEYLGSLQAYFNISLLKKRLDHRTKHEYTSFAIIDLENEVLIRSDAILERYWGIKEGSYAPQKLLDIVKSMTLSNTKSYVSYLNPVTGQNYCVLQLSIPSFSLVVSADPAIMKHKLIRKVWFKFIETSAVSFGFLLFIIVIYRREVSLRYKAEEAYESAVRAGKDKSNFLAYTAHEIRSPLGFILTGSEMMKNQLLGPLPQEYKEYVSGIHNNAQSILDFITDILDEDQIIGGNFKIHNEVVNIASLVRRVIRGYKAQYAERKMIFKQKSLRNTPLVICDLRRISQVLNNLMSNAIKYSDDDSIITIEMQQHGDHEVLLSIADTGIGMNADEINLALMKYGAVRKKETNFVESYGLGLAIVKVILDAHQFKIEIVSVPGKGSTVKIIIPKHKLIFSSKV